MPACCIFVQKVWRSTCGVKVGSNTQVAVQAILSDYKVEQQGYKSCMGLLKLADKYTPERLENACKRALEYTPPPFSQEYPGYSGIWPG